MAVPKRKHSNSRTGKRRSHDQIKVRQFQTCPRCGQPMLSHAVCPNENCGYYMGRTMVQPVEA